MTAPVGRWQKSGLVPQASPTASALRERKVLLVSKGRPWPRTGQYPLHRNWPTSPFSLWWGGRSETERLGGGGKMGIQKLGHSFSNHDVSDFPLSASAAGMINVATSLLFLFCRVVMHWTCAKPFIPPPLTCTGFLNTEKGEREKNSNLRLNA